MSLSGRVALVTGGARGIGLAIARRLVADGARAALADLDKSAVEAKAGVIGFTKALAKEVASRGIFVNAVAPAVIGTDMVKQMSKETVDYLIAKIPMGRVGRPEEVAALVAWLASDECSFSTGAVYDLSGGRATY